MLESLTDKVARLRAGTLLRRDSNISHCETYIISEICFTGHLLLRRTPNDVIH